MNNGINQIGEARLCVNCQAAMEAEYVMRCMGSMRRDYCERCGQQGRNEGLSLAMAIMFTALLDGGYLQPEDMPGAWDKVNYLSDSIAKGYVNAADMRKALLEEYGIRL